jgi:hypothetical protein
MTTITEKDWYDLCQSGANPDPKNYNIIPQYGYNIVNDEHGKFVRLDRVIISVEQLLELGL